MKRHTKGSSGRGSLMIIESEEMLVVMAYQIPNS